MEKGVAAKNVCVNMIKETEWLLHTTGTLLSQQEKIRKVKGEDFNIFSILKMERLEVRTHSAFIGELLNPSGSHQKGSLFLKLFLNELKTDCIDINSAEVRIEFRAGAVNNDNYTGGRIDILIRDKNNSTICIENKIDAGDQFAQVQRYYNFNQPDNKVFYLNLFGDEPDINSRKNLEAGVDFYIITYKKEILNWLEKCFKETTDTPILRESIKQYFILIKKITNTMDDKEKTELNELMLKYFKESSFVAESFVSLKAEIGENIRKEVKDLLQQKLGPDFNVYLGNNTTYLYAQIWIKYKEHDKANQYFGIESFSYKSNGAIDVGIFNTGGKPIDYTYEGVRGETLYWPYYQTISDFEGYSINFNEQNVLVKLYTDSAFKARLINHIVEESINFIELHKTSLLQFLERQ